MKAARQLGWTHIAAVKVEADARKARQIMIADNRTADVASYDDAALADILQSLNDDDLLQGTGWSTDEVEMLLAGAMIEPPPEDVPTATVEDGEPKSTEALREFVLMLRSGEHEQMGRWITHLERVWGTNGSVATVFQAVRHSAQEEGFSE